MSVVGYIEAHGESWELTDAQLLWAGRAAVGETGSARGQIAVLWAWAQLLVQRDEAGHACLPCRGQSCRPQTFEWVVRCHSQPVNEYWRFRGDNQERRQMLASASWAKLEQLSPGIRARVYGWARGQYANPVPRLADFSAPGQSDVPPSSLVIGGNAFFPEGASSRWPNDHVRIVSANDTSLFVPAVVGGGALLVGAALLVWLHHREKREKSETKTWNRRQKKRRATRKRSSQFERSVANAA